MHTYERTTDAEDGSARWHVGMLGSGPTGEKILRPLGPVWEKEEEAASFASYLNGGRWSPGELAGVLPPPVNVQAEAEKAREERRAAEKSNRPAGMDYPPEEESTAKVKAKAHAAKRKPEIKRSRHK